MKKYWELVLDEVVHKKAVRHFSTPSKHANCKYKKRRILRMYKLGNKFKDVYFSKREAECMMYLLRGKSIRNIAGILQLSPRSVEFYIRNMKKKLGCGTKFELIDLVAESDFAKNVDFE